MSEEKKDKLEASDLEEKSEKDTSEQDPIIPEEVLEAIPEEERGRFQSIIRQTMISGVMGRRNPIAEKVTSEHITQMISTSDEQDQRDRKERNHERFFNIGLLILGLLFIGFLIVYLKDDKELLTNVIVAILSFIGGFGFGKTNLK